MEFFKRKHFSLWIITAFTFGLLAANLSVCNGLQGVPTWICLGIKSPFIEFRNEYEVLANNSIPLNITKDEQALMHQEGLRKSDTFLKPVDLRDSETGYVKADLTKKIPSRPPGLSTQRRLNPIQEEMDQKQIILLDEETDENGLPASLTEEDRKFIVPMALKNPMPHASAQVAAQRSAGFPNPPNSWTTPRSTTTTKKSTTVTTKKRGLTTPPTPDFASNIDDLKKHLLFLQNLTKHDSNFQSKFVVFPSLQKDKIKGDGSKTGFGPLSPASSDSSTTKPFRPIFQYSGPMMPPHPGRKIPYGGHLPGAIGSGAGAGQSFGGYYHNEEDENDSFSSFVAQQNNVNEQDKITIVPQVLLLNDNTLKQGAAAGGFPATTSSTTTSTSTSTTTTMIPITTPRRPTKLPACVRNPESPKCVRQRKREELQRQRERERLLQEQREFLPPRYEPVLQTLNNTKRFAVSIEIPDSFKVPLNESEDAITPPAVEESLQILSRVVRSQHKRRNIGGGLQGRPNAQDKISSKYGNGWLERDGYVSNGGRDFLLSSSVDQMNFLNTSTPSPTVAAYSEPVDLNPEHCYQVDGMTYGQKKQCALHTSVMPAISRGARAAIQECQYQFKNRRWNCSSTEDSTVFGPMTSIGSPEMAFIHALAAATVTSFIARACRDGQLASCGCSRGSRPKQLHDDWTWGGCGDNLEYAYKFATDFIDIREKETKRGTRGAGNPERKKGRLHQKRNHHQQQQQQQQQMGMQADDSSTTFNNGKNSTTTTTNLINNNNNMDLLKKGQQKDTTQTVNFDINSNSNTTTNNNNNVNTFGSKDTATSPVAPPKQDKDSLQPNENNNNNNNKNYNNNHNGDDNVDNDDGDDHHDNPANVGGDAGVGGVVGRIIKPEDLLELQERITKEILNSKLQEKEMLELQEKINREILNSKVFNLDSGNKQQQQSQQQQQQRKRKRKNQRAVNGNGNGNNNNNNGNGNGNGNIGGPLDEVYHGNVAMGAVGGKWRHIGSTAASAKARSLMNLHNNEAGRRAVIKKTRITCKCHGVSGSCSLITCWQQLSSIREIGDYLREKYEESTEVKLNKRGRLQVKDPQFKVPTAHDLVHLDSSPDWCRSNRQLQWPGTHGRVCNKTSSGLDGCGILCCGRGYNTKNIVVRERCNCKFHWCCQVKCDVCVKVIEEHTCK